ncbi:hypothetical protein RN001_002025 [Aquatica leii]|uniref:Uncharacterized protein n=1 Tax=Aquatica leii TaxID=1421715 RepID=A0AAN7Q4T3_9COLE|nr:hypothetical protein RN001_002025 [Aquatica leii]
MAFGITRRDLGAQIRQHVEQQLSHLKYLGDDIQREVHRNLVPVYALKIKSDLRNGVGGVTTVTYSGNRRRNFIIRNGRYYVCYGNLRGPDCDGPEEPFSFKSQEDFCFSKSYVAFNDQVCLSNSAMNVQMRNNQVSCNSVDGSPSLLLTKTLYFQMCGDVAYYTYYANPNDPLAIPIPNPNPAVKCLNAEPGVCHFTEATDVNHGNSASSYSTNSFSYSYDSF